MSSENEDSSRINQGDTLPITGEMRRCRKINSGGFNDYSIGNHVVYKTPIPAGFEVDNIFGFCNGLVCLSMRPPSGHCVIAVANLATRKHRILPPLEQGFKDESPLRVRLANYVFGYDSSGDEYKVIRITDLFDTYQYEDEYEPTGCEFVVYSLNENAWGKESIYLPFHALWHHGTAFVSGKIHFLLLSIKGECKYNGIEGFNLSTEKFHGFIRCCLVAAILLCI
ncbi:F-box protein CPR1-like [Rutidosis leptorrhynchoides]|uniref:F-box protein CPR1-like n=1 Tax=Rutidosis leptorrhynchoides TaxID=125765 RepID=UPI003A9975B1